MMRRTLLLLALAGTPVAAADCPGATTQMELNQCAGATAKAADDELNSLYKQVRARLRGDDATTKLLVAAQRAWIAYRDAECTFAASGFLGGSIYPMVYAGCLESVTNARIEDFRRYLACEEGDLSCPLPPG